MEDTVGALDLGGASTQITFLPGTTIDDSNTRALLRLYGTNYSIYTHSYLCYGQMQALKRLMASLHQVIASCLVLSCSQSPGLTELGRQRVLGVMTRGLGAFVQAAVRIADAMGPPAQEPPQACPNTRAGMKQMESDTWCLTTGTAKAAGAWGPVPGPFCPPVLLPCPDGGAVSAQPQSQLLEGLESWRREPTGCHEAGEDTVGFFSICLVGNNLGL